ncbi:MAG: hypothetical protein II200_02555, partial [Bacteroidaceae bacterium]|nr:hypothetical protein [Bacteroidaceae bacterium]
MKTTSEVIFTTSDLVLTTFEVVFAHFWAKKGGNRVASPFVIQRYNKICRNANRAFFSNLQILTIQPFILLSDTLENARFVQVDCFFDEPFFGVEKCSILLFGVRSSL